MNKTIIININGFIFHIEEDAYEILKNYMTDVKRHFINSADSLEITTDIENRIAEMFTGILTRDNKQVIIEQDVKSVIEQMGRVEDFANAEDDADALNDTYIYNGNARKLFRDGDDHILGGVCAGLANYFDTQVIWIRLAFIISFLFAGSGFLLYIILWAVIPKATTRADRMAMKGQKLNLQGFKKNIEDEMNSVRESLSGIGNEARPMVYKARDFFSEFFRHFGSFIIGAARFFAKFLAVVVLIACFGALVGLIITIIAFLAYGKMGLYHIFPFNMLESQLNTFVLCAAFLLLAIPLSAIIGVILSAVFKAPGMGRTMGGTLLVIWLITLGVVMYYTAKVSAGFRRSASFSQNVNIQPTRNNTYYLKLNDVKYMSPEDSIRYNIKDKFNGKIILNDDDGDEDNFESPDNVSLSVEKSDVNKPVLVESFSARGYDYGDALANAQNTIYHFSQQDTVLKFNRRLEKPLNRLWRDQEIHLTLKIPVNATVVFDRKLQRILEHVDLYECAKEDKKEETPYAAFVMTSDGLQCKIDTLVTDPKVKTTVRK